ncbi:MAG: Stp1/IreP family PP2C-type Ser/Thr phosphatase [Myxococcales bacterium]|nr:Stp1/IreP family PP2C-type Ser/Thr phosphatase [Myxococcales bacterium]
MELSFWAATDVGRKREHNEDNFLVDKKLSLFVVADGMGGHASGEVASHLAVHELRRVVEEDRPTLEAYQQGKAATQDVLQILEEAVQSACQAVFRRGQQDPDKRGMGTTASVLLVVGERGFIAHVGDSRIYLLRQGQVVQLTEDHSLVNELIRRGKVTKETLAQSPYASFKNAVTRAVGVYETVQVDTIDFDILPGDQFLLCSDGLHAYLDERRTLELMSEDDVTQVPQRLIDHANRSGGIDNITAVVIRIQESVSEAQEVRSEELTQRIEVLRHMPLFRYLTYREIMRVLNVTEVADYDAGQGVLKEGEPGDELYIILRGKLKLHKENTFITHLEPGAHLGEMALVDRSPRSVSATAEERSRLLVLRRREFYEIIRKHPPLSVKLLWSFVQVLAERLRKTTADLSGARQEAHVPDMSADVLFDE